MPSWTPVQVALFVGLLTGSLWTMRVVAKNYSIAGLYMLIESRFYRSVVVNFTIAALVFGLIALLLAGLVWVLVGVFSLLG